MKVYLDNCILVDIEKGNLNLSDFSQIKDAEYFFSLAHICELGRGVAKTPDLKRKRLSTLSELCGENYLDQDSKGQSIEQICNSAEIVFDRCEPYRTYTELIESKVSQYNPNRDKIIEELEIIKNQIGNIEPSKIFCFIESKLMESSNRFGIDGFLRRSEAFTLKTKYLTLFNLLDSLFYWKDDKHINRLYDSAHACYAQYCDILVTNDRRMAIKAKAIYSYLGVKTIVKSSEEYIHLFVR